LIVVLIGGTRSGKSEVGERTAARLGEPVTVVVPATVADPDFAARVAAHRERRPSTWTTVECGADLVHAVRQARGTLLVDSLGTWVAATCELDVDSDALVEALAARDAPTVVVTEEVGLTVHAPTEVGRRFTDVLGALNMKVAAIADEMMLVVAGRVLHLEPPNARGSA